MENKFEECEQHYEKVVNYFTQQHQFNLMTYDNFFVGYSLFKIGIHMLISYSLFMMLILLNYLETAHVQTTTIDESQNVLALQQLMSTEFEEYSHKL